MRKVVPYELCAGRDGVAGRVGFFLLNAEMEEASAPEMAASDAMLMGRVTYERMAGYWPNQPGGTPMVDYINSVPKYVVSTTLQELLEWNNSTLIKGKTSRRKLSN